MDTKIVVLMIVAILPLIVQGVHAKSSRWGCRGTSDCLQSCRRSCVNFLRPLCYQGQCYCQAPSYLRADYRRANLSPNEPPELFDYELKP